jgi:hypothetical protein
LLHPRGEFAHVAESFGAYRVAEQIEFLHERLPEGYLPEVSTGAYWSRGYLAVVPAVRLPGMDTRVRRLVELATLPVVDHRFWEVPRQPLDVAPLVLIEAVRGRAPYLGYLPLEDSPAAAAFGRARHDLQFVELPPDAESALAGFIDACLNGNSGLTEPPPRALAYA